MSILLAAWYQALAVKSEGGTSIKGFSDSSSLSLPFSLWECFHLSRLQLKSFVNHRGRLKVLAVANPGLDPSAVYHTIESMAHLTRERQVVTVMWADSGSR